MVTITFPSELEKAVAEEAAREGTTAERLTLEVLQRRFLSQPSKRPSPEGDAASEKQLSRAAASMQPMDLSKAEASSLEEALATGAARPKIKIARLPEYEG